jgi:SAM-dependent methyltransferase
VLGVDLSEAMLREAAGRAAAAGVVVHLLRANLVELDGLAEGSFDYAACLFSTLGMVAGAKERRRVVGHVHRLLRPGGIFVLHVHNRWFNCWDRAGRRWLVKDVLGSCFGRGGGDRPMPAHQGLAGLALHHFSRREAVRLVRSAGFRIREVRPVGLRPDGRLPCPWWFGGLRAYGYLLAAVRLP